MNPMTWDAPYLVVIAALFVIVMLASGQDLGSVLPILGVYGTMQLAPVEGLHRTTNRSLQNSVVTAFIYPR